MPDNLDISKYLSDVLKDWRESREAFPANTAPCSHWPIPFFGNPASAIVATVGINPTCGEFQPSRNWNSVQDSAGWKRRLKNYFNQNPPAHVWFKPWRVGLSLLDCSYEAGTAAHFDISYRPTTAMIKNPKTDSKEFRAMAERDVQWFFKLLLLCPNLRVLLTMGPIIGTNSKPGSLLGFLYESAPHFGFKMIRQGVFWHLWHEPSRKVFVAYEADFPSENCVTCRVVKSIHLYRDELRERMVKLDLA